MESYGTKLARLFSKHSLHLEAIAYPTARHTCMSQQVAITMIMQQRHFEVSHAGTWNSRKGSTNAMTAEARTKNIMIFIKHQKVQNELVSSPGDMERSFNVLALFQHAESVRRYITIDVQIFTSYKYAQIECSSFDKFN
ncbi:hypothetical protein KCU86_g25, partial [Aureobasidium melanogenum]